MKVINSSPTFTSRNAYIRRADDIVRHVRNEFPMFSPTLVFENWKMFEAKNPSDFIHATKTIRKHIDIIEDYRKITELSRDNPCFADIFEKVQQTKVGNCREASTLTLATLFANDYRAIKIAPMVEMHVIDKNGQDVFVCHKFCDHSVVMAKMDKGNPESTKDVVILDTWAGKAMDYKEALKEYKDRYMARTYPQALLRTHKELIKEKGLFRALAIILDSKTTYKPKMAFGGSKEIEFSFEEGEKYGKMIAEKFPQVMMREK